MRYLVTGHTGFKGTWLTILLASQGHDVFGLSLDPPPGSMFELSDASELCAVDQRGDIRDLGAVTKAVDLAEPDVVIHLAAQPLVLDSYKSPRWTMETNVMGTLNVLEAVGSWNRTRALLVVTTDKVYLNLNQRTAYVERDPLGGRDPYSASKAMADILTHSWASSFPGTRTAVARAGNVIGGGDSSPDRLLPDLLAHLREGRIPILRNPDAVRPWQHVLDCLHGYQKLINKLAEDKCDINFEGGWNFGPETQSFVPVGEVASSVRRKWGASGSWVAGPISSVYEAQLLSLDSTRARTQLDWSNLLDVDEAINWTLDWYRALDSGISARDISLEQINAFQRKKPERQEGEHRDL